MYLVNSLFDNYISATELHVYIDACLKSAKQDLQGDAASVHYRPKSYKCNLGLLN